ncbi:MAG TPA: hypothetical protein VGR82_10350 [Methylomirabilota bacterium]|jgi:hypothetical protein|nr:hypothetical protein [Methylomirabilota bacterium]
MTSQDARAQFDAECRAAGLTLTGRDADAMYEMWLEWLPERDRLRAAVPELEDEPWR